MAKPKSTKPIASKAAKQRDAKGKFIPGNAGGPGRGSREREDRLAMQEAAYLRHIRKTIGLDEIEEVVRRLYKAALKGSIPAARTLLELVTPAQRERGQFERELPDSEMVAGEFRIAGKLPSETMAEVLAAIQADVEAARAREKQLFPNGFKPNPVPIDDYLRQAGEET